MKLTDARAAVRDAAGPELVERLEHLDALPAVPARATAPRVPDAGTLPDFDVVIAGGGLSLLYAPLLAAAGLKVAVVERSRAGSVHREWNASRPELEQLVASGLITAQELDEELIVSRYRHGVCRWFGGGEHAVRGVLDCALDAGTLLGRIRELAERRGVTIFDGTSVTGHAAGERAVRVSVQSGATASEIVARVLVDARGASSPLATADLVCPTVGGVLSGLDVGEGPSRIQPDVGEILATTEHVEEGRQHFWEAFPGRPGETTVYLFFYAQAREPRPGALTALYGRFFSRLPSYKQGHARLERPTFGLIPGWSRLGPPPSSGHPRVVLVGDAAARHSPLTFCGFGSTLRSIQRASAVIVRATEGAPQGAEPAVDDATIHRGTGALSMLLASPQRRRTRPSHLNELLDAAFGSLSRMGDAAYGRLLRDEMQPREFVDFLTATAKLRPSVYLDVLSLLGPLGTLRWSASLARSRARA